MAVRREGWNVSIIVGPDSRARDDDHTPAHYPYLSVTREVTMITVRESERRLFSPALLPVLASGVLALPHLHYRAAGGECQPNALKCGSVRVGATAEGSVRIFREGENASGLAIKVEPPAFVRVEDIQVGSQEYGANIRGYCDIRLSLDTRRAGDYSGELHVEIGREQVAIPVGV